MDLTVPQPLALPTPGVVQVWQLHCSTARSQRSHWHAWLSLEERDRLQRYRQSGDRDRFILSRGGLRYLLAGYLGIAPAAVRLDYGEYGKPLLLTPAAAPLHFNVAHSGDWVIWGFSPCPYIGVDVEMVQPRQRLSGLIQRCLTTEESDRLPTEPAARLYDFLCYWTVKEAHLKAVGLGLTYPLQQVQVALRPQPRLVTAAQVGGQPDGPWDVHLWQPAPDAIAAVCVGYAQATLQFQSFAAASGR